MTIQIIFKGDKRTAMRLRKVDKVEFNKKSKYWNITLKNGTKRFINSRIYEIEEERL